MANDFTGRRPRVQSLRECLLRDDEGRELISALELASRAGAVIAPVLKRFHFAVDFSDPSYCRIDDHTLVLLVTSADQENRLRQLLPRIRATLATAGLPLTEVLVHIIPKNIAGNEKLKLARCDMRPASASGAAAIDRELESISDPELKETLTKLRDTLAPDYSDTASGLDNRLAQESLELAERRRELSLKESDISYGIDATSIPTDEEVADIPPLVAIRERLLGKLAERTRLLNEVRTEIARIDKRLETINLALTVFPENPIRAEAIASEDLYNETDDQVVVPPSPPVSAAAQAALSALVTETQSPQLRKTIERLRDTLTPQDKEFADSLRNDIRQEMNRLSQLSYDKRTPAQKKRLDHLTEALSILKSSDSQAHRLAVELYGSIA